MTMKQKIMTITFSWKILEKKIDFLEIGPFRKLGKTFFLSKISIGFLHKFSLDSSLIFQIETKSLKT